MPFWAACTKAGVEKNANPSGTELGPPLYGAVHPWLPVRTALQWEKPRAKATHLYNQLGLRIIAVSLNEFAFAVNKMHLHGKIYILDCESCCNHCGYGYSTDATDCTAHSRMDRNKKKKRNLPERNHPRYAQRHIRIRLASATVAAVLRTCRGKCNL